MKNQMMQILHKISQFTERYKTLLRRSGFITMALLMNNISNSGYYSQNNFDKIVHFHGYIALFSLVGVIIGAFSNRVNATKIMRYGLCSFFTIFMSIMCSRAIDELILLTYVFKMASIIYFLLLSYHLWIMSSNKLEKYN